MVSSHHLKKGKTTQHFIKLINKITMPSGGPFVGRFLELESYSHFWTGVQTLDVIGMGGTW